MFVRGEPEYVDQVPRRAEYEKTHPDVQISYHGAYWQAVIPQDDGETTVTRFHLEKLLDALEAMEPDSPPAPLPARRAPPDYPREASGAEI